MGKKDLIGTILGLFIANNKSKCSLEEKSIELDKHGVKGDKFYGKSIDRSILLTSLNSYEILKENDINAKHGELGENILISTNLDLYRLDIGTRLKIGEVLLEISEQPSVCSHLSSIDKQVPKLLKNDRGIFAKALNEGEIGVDEKVFLVEN